ncbi:IS1182 family transposase [Metabacillus schmidteae]|uniref:IS1182 family transposase n=1 Tax=Metabacillus schmidteae TaxID=2730405 RepID=UPI00158B71F7|nr:IS1182 family transposase [Metabacillus schmidteae]
MKYDHISFVNYNMNQLVLPLDLEILIPQNHLSTIVHEAVEKLDDTLLVQPYKGGGRPSYHPKMLLKVIIYAYTQKVYSGRQMEKLLTENIYFMWLSGSQTPDFRTINRFRSERMRDIIYQVFFSIVELLREKGLVKLENYFVDGTKIEANANQYTFVWRKATEKYEKSLDDKYRQLASQIEHILEVEEKSAPSMGLEEKLKETPITSEQIEQSIKKLENHLETEPKDKEAKKAVRLLKKDYLPRKLKYEEQTHLFKGRNSFSKTDTDATFMRMKEDHMRNGQLKPGYNVQTGTEGQFITGFSLHQRAGDPGCLIPHLKHLEEHGVKPEKIVADSGYGSEENYDFLERERRIAYIKYNTFDQEQKRSWKKKIDRVENMEYDEELDEFICANKQRLIFQYETTRTSDNEYVSIKRRYSCFECTGCPFQITCAKGKDQKTITISLENQRQRKEIRERLQSEKGRKLYSQRKCDVESVFGQLKHNQQFRRFSMRGLQKNTIEWGLLCVAHNCKKMHKAIKENKESEENRYQ